MAINFLPRSEAKLYAYKIWPFFLVLILFGLSACVTIPSQKASVNNPNAMSFREHLRLGGIYEYNGNLRPALREYEKARSMRPDDGRPYFGIGNVRLRSGDLDGAEDSYRKAIEQDATTGVYFNNLAWVYIKMMRYSDAYSMATRGAALDPQRQFIYLDTIGVIEMRLGNYARAEQKLKEAAASMPLANRRGLLSVEENLYELYTLTGRAEDAALVQGRINTLKGSLGSTVPMLP